MPTRAKTPTMTTVESLLSRGRAERVIVFASNMDLRESYDEASQALTIGIFGSDEEKKNAAREVESARAELLADPGTVQIRMRAITQGDYDRMLTANKPTPEQLEEAEKRQTGEPAFNPDTFFPALISACCVEPELTTEQAQQILEEWSIGDSRRLRDSAIALCNQSDAVDLPN